MVAAEAVAAEAAAAVAAAGLLVKVVPPDEWTNAVNQAGQTEDERNMPNVANQGSAKFVLFHFLSLFVTLASAHCNCSLLFCSFQ